MSTVPRLKDHLASVRIFVAAVKDRTASILRDAAVRAAVQAFFIALVSAGVALVVTLLAIVIGGETVLGGNARHVDPPFRLGLRAAQTMQVGPTRATQRFTSGHLCLKYVDLQPRGEPVEVIGLDGVALEKFSCPKGQSCGACTKVVPDSDKTPLASVRRFAGALNIGDLWSSAQGVAVVMVLIPPAVVTAVATFLAVLLALTPAGFMLNVTASFARLGAIVARTARIPRLGDWPQPTEDPPGPPLAVQLSDLHMTSRNHVPYELEVKERPNAPDSAELRDRVSRLLSDAKSHSPLALLFTGDLTDSQHEDEWQSLRQASQLDVGDQPQLIAVPGNHDIQFLISHAADGTRSPDSWPKPFAERQRKCYEQIAKTFPGAPVHFPSITTLLRAEPPVDVIAIDSCRYESNWLLSNAVGQIGLAQLSLVKELLDNSDHPKIVLVHHHVGWKSDPLRKREGKRDSQDILMCATDGRELLELLAQHSARVRQPVLVLHGHKHMEMSGCYRSRSSSGAVYVQGAPSSTLGNSATADSPPDGKAYRVQIWLHEGCWRTRVLPLPNVIESA